MTSARRLPCAIAILAVVGLPCATARAQDVPDAPSYLDVPAEHGFNYYFTKDALDPNALPLRWYRADVPMYTDSGLCSDPANCSNLTPDATIGAIQDSMATWNGLQSCEHPALTDLGLVTGAKPVGKGRNGEVGADMVVFEAGDAWTSDKAGVNLDGVIALTTLFYDPGTGEIRSYVLEADDGDYEFAVLDHAMPRLSGLIDLPNTLTHEMGHVLGLDHSTDPQATMYKAAPPGEILKRDLAPDDVEGLCSLYAREYAEVNPESSGGGGKGCAASAAPRSADGPAGFPRAAAALAPALLALAGLALSRRPRPRRAP